jgi:hypothetical protein
MTITDNLVKVFGGTFKVITSEEDLERFVISYRLATVQVPVQAALDELLKQVYGSDNCTIYINIDDATDVIRYSLGDDFEQFKSDLEVKIRGIEAESSIIIKVQIEKKLVDNKLFIYALDDIKAYLDQFQVATAINFFSELIRKHGTLILISSELSTTCQSATLAFQPALLAEQEITFTDPAIREKRLQNIQVTTHAITLSGKLIVPEDLQFSNELKGVIKHVLGKIEFTLLIIALFDNSSIDDDELTFRLNGYKSIEGKVNLATLPFENYLEEYRNIYNWIHESGNLTDKLGLARNIISLHLNTNNDLSFSGNMFSSILSAYKVYEKQNIKQYIEIRNKMSDQLLDYNKRANSIVEGFAGTFQKSALSVLTLFSSIVAVKILSTSAISPKFALFSTLFAVAILVVSTVYMFISLSDTLAQKKRYQKSYKHFKKRYSDLLNTDDIDRILIGDKEFKADKTFMKRKIRTYTILWGLVLLTLLIFVIIYYFQER